MNSRILEYLQEKYMPHTIMVYGSYANKTNNKNSDFDAIIISDFIESTHDGSIVDGIELDVFVYSTKDIEKENDFSKYVQIFDATICIDNKGLGQRLKDAVTLYIENNSLKSHEEKQHLSEWCRKMVARTEREDAEGYFRWHWVLSDSLEIYCMMRDQFYFGPKKTIVRMKEVDQLGYEKLLFALKEMNSTYLNEWIEYVIASGKG